MYERVLAEEPVSGVEFILSYLMTREKDKLPSLIMAGDLPPGKGGQVC
jgi:hypothetical protein